MVTEKGGYGNNADNMNEVGEGQWKPGDKFESNCRNDINVIFQLNKL